MSEVPKFQYLLLCKLLQTEMNPRIIQIKFQFHKLYICTDLKQKMFPGKTRTIFEINSEFFFFF